MFDRYKFPLNQVWNICTKPDATLRYEALLNAFYGKNILKQYVMPLAELLLVVNFLGTLLYSKANIPASVVDAIFSYLTFIVSYAVLFWLVQKISLRFYVEQVESRNVSLMVVSLMSVNFVVEFLLSIFPNLFFIYFFYFYIFYLVWVMSEGVIDIAEDKRNRYMAFVTIFVVFIPLILSILLKKIVPNL